MTTPTATDYAAHQLARLLAKHGDELARHLRRMVRDDDVAQDLLQDTLIRAHGALDRLAGGANTRAWLYRIATNVALNHLRARRREHAALGRHAAERDVTGGSDAAAEGPDERRATLWARVAALPERQRLAQTLRLADELDYAEIARRLGGTAEGARANVYQATRKLRLTVREP